jgi:alpha-tubulin suppressor-like RCC1 family protein
VRTRLTGRAVACLGALAVLGLVTPGHADAVHPAAAAAVSPGGVPWTWGANSFGQLGNGTTQARLTPGPVTGLDDVVDLHGGREHVIALRGNGTVWVWGSNVEGQLGLGTTANRSTPTQVPGLANVQAVETGHNFSLALMSDQTVRAWGLNADGQLGDGSTTLRRSPVTVVGLSNAVAIAGGRNMSYAIRADGTVVAWGRNDEGQVGDGTSTRRTTPVRVGTLTNIIGIAGGRDHGLALRSDGTVWAWGSNDYGQLGDGTTTDRHSPVQVMSGATEVIAGAQHSYALRTDGTVAAWGRNYRANLGDGTTTMRTRPVSVRNLSSVVSIGSGRDTGMAVLADGRLMAWGHNSTGQVGDGTTVNRSTPVLVPGVSGAVLAGGGGAEYSVVLVSSGPPPPQDPVAAFTAGCDVTSCSFDASGSTDSDGTVEHYDWDFGDGATSSGTTATTQHQYAATGTYPVTLTVTDNSGATDVVTHQVVAADEPPPTAGPQWRATGSSDTNTNRPAVTVPAAIQTGDRLVLFVSTNRAATLTTPTGWTLLGTVSDDIDVRSWVLTRAASAGLAGTNLTLTLDAISKTSLVLLAYSDSGAPSALTSRAEPITTTTHTAPAATVASSGSRVLRYYVDKGATVHTWTLAASLTSRATTTGSGSGFLTAAVGDEGAVAAGTAPALTATSGMSSGKAIAWTLVLPPV